MTLAFSPADLIDNGHGIYTLDAHYVAPRVASIHLIVSSTGEAAFFDTGTNLSWPIVEGALAALGIAHDKVRYVIPSHVHLDHAGGAGLMMSKFPQAHLVVHPRGARHMIDPGKLFAATIDVYGEEKARRLYGNVTPVPAARVVEATDGMQLALGERVLTVLDTPGHARHHICLVDGETGGVFTGDMFGLSYRQFDVDGVPSIIPTTTPSQFDPDAMKASIRRLLSLNAPAMYLTHFGKITGLDRLGEDLLRQLDDHLTVAQAARAVPAEQRHARIRDQLNGLFVAEAKRKGWPLSESALLNWLAGDIDLNAQGLAHWLGTLEAA